MNASSLLLVLLGVVVCYLLVGVLQWWRRRREGRAPPHWSWPIVGDNLALLFFLSPEDAWCTRFEWHGTRTRASLFGKELFITAVPEDAKRIFAAEGKEVQGWLPPHLHELEGKAITAVTGTQHKVLRKALFTLFTTPAMKSYFGTMKHFVEKHVREWKETPGPLTMMPLLRTLTYEAVYGCMIDKETATSNDQVQLYEEWINGFSSLPFHIPGRGLVKGLAAKEQLRHNVKALLDEAREEKTKGTSSKQHKATVVLMLLRLAEEMEAAGGEEGVLIDDETLIDNLLIFLLAGHETVLSTMCSLMKLLPEHPEVMRKALEEVRNVVPDGEELTFEHVQSLAYCTAIVKEVLRVVPPVVGAFREVLEPITLGQYTIPRGETIMVSYQGVHSQAFNDPKTFDPDRFHRESETYSTKYKDDDRTCFLSFAAGIRSCVGMKFAMLEVVTLLAVLMREKLVWDLVPGQDLSLVRGGISLKVSSGVIVNFLQEGKKAD
ncbi:Cytochrome P450, family 26, subfamily C, polypeptide 1 [Balamuthia mandrillaris]